MSTTTVPDLLSTAADPKFEAKPYGAAFTEYSRTHEDVMCVTNDLTASCEADEFRATFPQRYFSLGMAEQNLVGTLAGMAREGFTPFYPTFSVFATRRPYEQIALSVAYPALRVRIVGFLPGLTTPGGVTHQSIDDIALMSQLPNMTVLEVGDATEARSVLDVMDAIDGPVFLRMLRGQVPVLFDSPMRFNQARELAVGDDVLVLSSGVQTEAAMRVVADARSAGVQAGLLHISTLKPFSDPLVVERLSTAKTVITFENHLVRGGLGTSVAEVMAENAISARLKRIGVQDTFTHGGGKDYLLSYYGLDERALATAVQDITGARLSSAAQESASHGQQHNENVAEGL
jgi:transketolase